MAPRQVSAATKAMVSREEMDAALARLPRLPIAPQTTSTPSRPNSGAVPPAALRIQRIDTASAAFLYGSRDTMLDTACDFLAPDLRPVPPQPNCAQSMKIYEDHRKMAAEYLQVKTEMAELRNYKAQLQEQLSQGEEAQASPDEAQFAQLQSEKEALLAFKEKLAEQLAMIEAAQAQKGPVDSAHSTGEGWVVVGDPAHQGGGPRAGGENQ